MAIVQCSSLPGALRTCVLGVGLTVTAGMAIAQAGIPLPPSTPAWSSPRELPKVPTYTPSVVAGASTAAYASLPTASSRLGTFASPRYSSPPRTGLGTAPLPFAETIIDANQRVFPLAPDRHSSR